MFSGCGRCHTNGTRKGSQRDPHVFSHKGILAVGRLPYSEIGLIKKLGEYPETGEYAGPTPNTRLDIEKLHNQSISGFCPLNVHRPREGIKAVPIEGREVPCCRLGTQLVVSGIPSLKEYPVAGFNSEARLNAVVPDVMYQLFRKTIETTQD
jgi:hypothetical protein